MLKAVFFDLDGTLYDRDALVCELVAEQHAAFADKLSGVSLDRFVSGVLAMDDHGYGEKAPGYQRLVSEWRLDPALSDELCDHFWRHYDEFCRLSPDTAITLRTLRAHGMHMGVITNGGTERQRRKLAALGLADAFDVVLISEAEGVRKPSAEIFLRALERCHVEPEESVFVGDHPDTDIEGARNAGLLPIWKYVPYWPLPAGDVLTVHRLADILPTCLIRT
jgi:putative hydrolase of the HAD superfamily